METLYGNYLKKIICQCNAGEMDGDADTIQLNDRCPICHSLRQICIPKAEARMKLVSGMPVAQKTKEPVLTTQKVMEPLIKWDQFVGYQFDHSFYYFSYFMKLSEIYWTYAWAFLIPSLKMSQRKP